jgi:dTDP-4-dehydrorhamnose 3,5-epimerase-like enzyme
MVHHEKEYDNLVPGVHFCEWDIATSRKGVLRGIHYSPHCWKIYQCLAGAIYYVFVNCDETDEKYGEWASFQLEPFDQLLKPPKYAAGMLALEDNTILHYAQSQYYNAFDPDQKTFKWDYPTFGIWWPKGITPILSKRDDLGDYEFRLKK